MRRICACFMLCMILMGGARARAAGPLLVNGVPLNTPRAVYDNTTYVSLRAVAEALRPGIQVSWADGQAVAREEGFTLTARPGSRYITANDTTLCLEGGVRLEEGRTLVPIRPLAGLLGAAVDWDAATGAVRVTSLTGSPGDDPYREDALYWLSRIISAESQGEPLEGKIAVGNVILNRVASPDFPDTIYGVIFDDRWGGQFEPVRRGSIYWEPTEESRLAARMVLDGVQVAGDCLYFLAPALTTNYWIMENRPYVMTIGSHWFYQ